jgi:phosphatidylserine/phosphatidylglycerophosphate/cardiolipin synthase-like enzyme
LSEATVNGLNASQLASIPQELKEAVCCAVVKQTTDRISGIGNEGRIIFGLSPRRSIVSGQPLPRFDPTGQDDETTDIRIAAIGIDFHALAGARGTSVIQPSFCVYVRVLPHWSELTDAALDLEIQFKLQSLVQAGIDARIRQLRTERFQSANVATPDWPNLNPAQRQAVKERRSRIQEEVRRQAYQEVGIRLEDGDEQLLEANAPDAAAAAAAANPDAIDGAADAAPDADANAVAHLRLGRLLQRGRTIPFGLLDPAPIPAKWHRIDLTFEPFSWPLECERTQLAALLDDYNQRLRQSAARQVTDWFQSPEGIRSVWRDEPGALRLRQSGARILSYAVSSLRDDGQSYEDTFHAKIVLADGVAAYVGSANFLYRSRETNLECGFLLEGDAVAPVAVMVDALLGML